MPVQPSNGSVCLFDDEIRAFTDFDALDAMPRFGYRRSQKWAPAAHACPGSEHNDGGNGLPRANAHAATANEKRMNPPVEQRAAESARLVLTGITKQYPAVLANDNV